MPSPSEAALTKARAYLASHIRVNEGDVMQLAHRLDSFAAAQVEAAVTRLESRLAAAEKLRNDVESVIRRQPAHNNEVGFFVVHLDEDGAEHIEQVDPAAVLACTVGCLTDAIATYDATKETTK